MKRNTNQMKRFFVVGCSRGGTTLVQSILGSHSAVATLPETAYFQRIVGGGDARLFGEHRTSSTLFQRNRNRIRHALRMTTPTFDHAVESLSQLTRTTCPRVPRRTSYAVAAKHFVAVMDEYALRAGCTAWLEKTPSHIHYLEEIQSYIPDAKFVHVIRDGVAVVASLHSAAKKYPDAHWPRLYPTLDRCIARWNECTRLSIAHAHLSNHILLRFEDLVTSPRPTAEELCERLGLAFEPMMLTERKAPVVTEGEPWKSGVQGTITMANQTNPRDILDYEQIDYIRKRLISFPHRARTPAFSTSTAGA